MFPKAPDSLPRLEFIALMAMIMSLVALTIDSVLPALGLLGQDLAVANPNDVQPIISVIFLGIGFGQLLFGPLSDSFGRRRPIFLGFAIFALGSLLCIAAQDLQWMLIGRFLQGLGLAAPRTLALALIRDQYSGVDMARLMSFIMSIFILVPMLAPALGQLLLYVSHWRGIFVAILVYAMISALWFYCRQRETLAAENRRPFTPRRIAEGVKEVLSHPVSFGYIVLLGAVQATFLAYLSASQQLFQDGYNSGDYFALIFAVIAFGIGFASFMNGKLVGRFGMQTLLKTALRTQCMLALAALAATVLSPGLLPLGLAIGYFLLTFFCCGISFGNLNALAMGPLGHIAGIGAAVVGAASSLLAVPLGTLLAAQFNGTPTPLIIGFLMSGIAGLLIQFWIERRTRTEHH